MDMKQLQQGKMQLCCRCLHALVTLPLRTTLSDLRSAWTKYGFEREVRYKLGSSSLAMLGAWEKYGSFFQ